MTEIEKSTPISDGAVSATAASVYHQRFVPSLFGQFPPHLLRHAAVRAGDHVLDVGCGTGIVAAAAAPLVGSSGRVAGLDPNPSMLTVAEQTAGSQIEWVYGAAESLPFEPASFDVVVSQFALMFFADAPAGLREMARVLKRHGRFAAMTWAHLPRSPGFEALVGILRRNGCDEAAEELVAPYTIGTPSALESIVRPAFPDATVEVVAGAATFPSIDDFISVNLDGWTMESMVDEEQREAITAAARAEFTCYTAADGSIRFPVAALVARA